MTQTPNSNEETRKSKRVVNTTETKENPETLSIAADERKHTEKEISPRISGASARGTLYSSSHLKDISCLAASKSEVASNA